MNETRAVYITNANLERITKSLSNSLNIDENGIWEELKTLLKESGLTLEEAKTYFSFKEHKQMYLDSVALENFTRFAEIFEDIDVSKVSIQNSVNARPPAYHYDKQCEAMLSNYFSIKPPAGLKEFQSEMISFARANTNIGEAELKLALQKKYNTNEEFEIVEYENSGAVELNREDTLSYIHSEIKTYLEKLSNMMHNTDNQFIANVVNRLKFADITSIHRAFRGKKNNPEYIVAEEFALHKLHIRRLLIQYYKYKKEYDINEGFIEFDENLLCQLGFKACKKCTQNVM